MIQLKIGELVLMKQELQQLCKFTSTADTFSDSERFVWLLFIVPQVWNKILGLERGHEVSGDDLYLGEAI